MRRRYTFCFSFCFVLFCLLFLLAETLPTWSDTTNMNETRCIVFSANGFIVSFEPRNMTIHICICYIRPLLWTQCTIRLEPRINVDFPKQLNRLFKGNFIIVIVTVVIIVIMMTSSNGNIFRVTGPLCGEFTGDRWIPLAKASHAELPCFLWSAPE